MRIIDNLRSVVRALPGGSTLDSKLRDQYWVQAGRNVIANYMAHHDVRKLHLGCGANMLRGWLNTDYAPRNRSILRLDATKSFTFADCTFDRVFSEHMIEHLPFEDGLHLLRESYRVLKPGGRIRITTPDMLFLRSLLADNPRPLERRYIEWSHQTFVRRGPVTSSMVVNNFVRSWGHQFIYDRDVLRSAFEEAGFTAISEHAVGESEDAALRGLEYEDRLPEGFLRLESLTLEGSKTL